MGLKKTSGARKSGSGGTHEHFAGEFGPTQQRGKATAANKDPAYRAARAQHYAGIAHASNIAHASAHASGMKAEAAKHALVAAHAEKRAALHSRTAAKLAPGSPYAHAAAEAHANTKIANVNIQARASAKKTTSDLAHNPYFDAKSAVAASNSHNSRMAAVQHRGSGTDDAKTKTTRANIASGLAHASPSAATHSDAANAHSRASSAHSNIGNASSAATHAARSKEHAAKATTIVAGHTSPVTSSSSGVKIGDKIHVGGGIHSTVHGIMKDKDGKLVYDTGSGRFHEDHLARLSNAHPTTETVRPPAAKRDETGVAPVGNHGDEHLASVIHSTIDKMPEEHLHGVGHSAYISHVHDQLSAGDKAKFGSLDHFKNKVVALNRKGLITIHRADVTFPEHGEHNSRSETKIKVSGIDSGSAHFIQSASDRHAHRLESGHTVYHDGEQGTVSGVTAAHVSVNFGNRERQFTHAEARKLRRG